MCDKHTNVPTTAPTVEIRPVATPVLSAGGPAVSRAAAEVAGSVRTQLASDSASGAPLYRPAIEARPAPAPAPAPASRAEAPAAPAIQAPRAEVAERTGSIVAEASKPTEPKAAEVASGRKVMVDIQRHQKGFVGRQPNPLAMKGGHKIQLRLVGNQAEVTFLEVKGEYTDAALAAAVQAWINDRVK